MDPFRNAKTYDYQAYIDYFAALLKMPELPPLPESAKGDFRKLNHQRMEKWNKILQLSPPVQDALANISRPMRWYVIGDLNCGDCAQSLPVLARMAAAAGEDIDMRILLKEDHPELMDMHLTDGSRAVPKLIALDRETSHELFRWGARPASALQIYHHYRENKSTMLWEDFEKELHLWYARDRGQEVQQEIAALLSNVSAQTFVKEEH